MESETAVRVRDRHLIRLAVHHQHALLSTNRKVASRLPEAELVAVIVESLWEPRPSVSSKTAFLGITKAVSKLMDLFRKAPQAWQSLQQTLEIEDWDTLSLAGKVKALGSKLSELMREGKTVLSKALKHAVDTFPLNLFFAHPNKMPGLTDILHRIMKASPAMQAALSKIHAGAVRVDKYLDKYLPTLRKPLYAAVFIYVWLQASELSWDMKGILAGFTGQISLSELLGSMPESGLGLIAAVSGLGYGALPYVLIARIIWLVAQGYLDYKPGTGLVVHWAKMGIRQRSEVVPV